MLQWIVTPAPGGDRFGGHVIREADVVRIHVRMVGEMRRSVAEALQAKPRVVEEQEGVRRRGGRGVSFQSPSC